MLRVIGILMKKNLLCIALLLFMSHEVLAAYRFVMINGDNLELAEFNEGIYKKLADFKTPQDLKSFRVLNALLFIFKRPTGGKNRLHIGPLPNLQRVKI